MQALTPLRHDKILKDNVIYSHSFVEIMGGRGYKQG
jgi:hypothetical protein